MCGHVLGLPACHPQTQELLADWLTWVLLSYGGREPEDKESSRGRGRGGKGLLGPRSKPKGQGPLLLGLCPFIIALCKQRPTVCQTEPTHTTTGPYWQTDCGVQLCLVLGQTLKWSRLPQQRPLSEACQMLPLSLKSPCLWWHLGIPDSSGPKDIE